MVVIKSSNIAPYKVALKGFKETVEAKITENSINSDKLINIITLINDIISKKPDVIVGMGKKAIYMTGQIVSDIPVVYTMSSISQNKKLKKYITGVTLAIPLKRQIAIFKEILPEVKKMGVIFSEKRVKDILNKARPILHKAGIELITEHISSIKDIPSAMKNIMSKTDCLWLIYDKKVMHSVKIMKDYIILKALRNKFPVIGFNRWSVISGALFCISTDYEKIGKQTGKIINRILKGEKPSSIPIETPEDVKIIFNKILIQKLKSKVKINFPKIYYKVESGKLLTLDSVSILPIMEYFAVGGMP